MDRPPRRIGRPPLKEGEPSVDIYVRVCASDFDRIYHLAQRHDVSMAQVMRVAARRLLRDDEDE